MQKFPYEDILNAEAPTLTTRKPMPLSDRAAQFSPFAALTGYDDAVKETARLTDTEMERDEDLMALLNNKLNILIEKEYEYPEITVEYFLPDDKKSGGAYRQISGTFKKVDMAERNIVFASGEKIPIDYVYNLYGEIFDILNI